MWFRTPRKARPASARSASSRLGKWLRPRLEVLDDRCVPTISAGGPYTVAEGGWVTLHAVPDPNPPASLTYSWDMDADGNFGEVGEPAGANPTLTWTQLQALGITDGSSTSQYQVKVRASDGTNTTDSVATTLTVDNVAPTAVAISNGVQITEGGSVNVRLVAPSDPSPVDTAAGFRYSFALNSAALATRYAGSFAQASNAMLFTFGDDGIYTVYGRIFDKNDGYNDILTIVTVINAPPVVDLLQGAVDTGFGTNGVATTSTGDLPSSPSQLADGRIVAPVFDGATPESHFVGFRRFLTNGSPDPSFDTDGRMVFTPVLSTFAAYTLQGDKIIVASQNGSSVALQRFNADGSPDDGSAADTDPSDRFGTSNGNGSVIVSNGINRAVVITVMASGQILLVGGTDTGMTLVRCTSNGVLDSSFGTNGVAANSTPRNGIPGTFWNTPAALVVAPEGILVGDYYFAVLRFTSTGVLDTNFVSTGIADQVFFGTPDLIGGDPLSALALVPGGGILAAGNFGIARYTTEGQLVTSFGYNGVVGFQGVLSTTDGSGCAGLTYGSHGDWYGSELGLGVAAGLPFPAGVAIDSEGRILVAGPNGRVGRLNADGSPDTTFGSGPSGIVTPLATSGNMTGMLLQTGGRVTLVGNATGSIELVRFTTLPTTNQVIAGQTFNLGFRATDPAAGDQAAGFLYEIDWDGNGTWVVTEAQNAGNGSGVSRTHVYVTAGTYPIKVRATDRDNGTSQVFQFDVTVSPLSTANLQSVLAGSLATDPVSGLPAAAFTATSQPELDAILDAILDLSDQSTPVAVVVNVTGGTYNLRAPLSPPAGVTLVVNGIGPDPKIFPGQSPALTLTSGNVIFVGATFVNATDAPTILVTGGRLTLRDSVIQESTGFSQAAIQVTGGTVDLGTAADPGDNTINLNGAGGFFGNATATPAATAGVAFTVNGTPLAPAAPSSVQGLVWVDANNNGEVDFGEEAVAGVAVTLIGTDDLGNAVHQSAVTDAHGVYSFGDLRPSGAGGYTIAETQPAGLLDGRLSLGTVNGVATGSTVAANAFSGVVIAQGGSVAENYNFGERPGTTGGTHQTAAIGFWQNKKGQDLIKALNDGPASTQLGHWLAVTFPNMYAALDGMTNAQVAAFYKTLFARNGHTSPGGPPKTDAQVMATALAVYVTNQSLAGTTAAAYGFQVTSTGVGTRTFNVGTRGAAFGVANGSFVSVMDLLLAVNARSRNGLLYDADGNGQIDSTEAGQRTMANDVFSAINEAGGLY